MIGNIGTNVGTAVTLTLSGGLGGEGRLANGPAFARSCRKKPRRLSRVTSLLSIPESTVPPGKELRCFGGKTTDS